VLNERQLALICVLTSSCVHIAAAAASTAPCCDDMRAREPHTSRSAQRYEPTVLSSRGPSRPSTDRSSGGATLLALEVRSCCSRTTAESFALSSD
jgi:hypothetical protein